MREARREQEDVVTRIVEADGGASPLEPSILGLNEPGQNILLLPRAG